jgi:two-component system, NarL family, response regulator NreC
MITVFLADDHETVREGLRLLVNAQPDMRVIAEAGDGAMAVQRARVARPQVIVIDLAMPEMNGLAATKVLRESLPGSAIITLTRHGDRAYAQQLFAAGAHGYVLKQSSSSELLKAIRCAAAGETYVDPALRRGDSSWSPLSTRGQAITERETAVLRLMAVGYGNKDIAAELQISVKTVEVHKANAMRKLKLSSRTDVVRYAAVNGWLRDP